LPEESQAPKGKDKMKQIIALFTVSVFSFSQVACMKNTTPGVPGTGPNVPALLEAALDAAAVAYATLNPQAAPTIALITQCGSAAVTELGTSDSGALKATKIGAACAAALTSAQNLGPTGQVIAAALSSFLAAIEPLEGVNESHALASSQSMTISASTAKRINQKIAALNAKLAGK
jgi:2-methylaconitate cis-trans-isomerase PrpF